MCFVSRIAKQAEAIYEKAIRLTRKMMLKRIDGFLIFR